MKPNKAQPRPPFRPAPGTPEPDAWQAGRTPADRWVGQRVRLCLTAEHRQAVSTRVRMAVNSETWRVEEWYTTIDQPGVRRYRCRTLGADFLRIVVSIWEMSLAEPED